MASGGHAPVELGIFFGVLRGLATLLHISESFTLVSVGFQIAFRVVTGTTAYEQVVPLAHTGHGILMVGRHATGPAGHMLIKYAVVMPGDRGFGFEDRKEIEAFEFGLEAGGDFHAGNSAQRRKEIQMGSEVVDLVRRPLTAPAPVGKGAGPALPCRGFASAHIGIVGIQPPGLTIIRHENHDRAFIKVLLFQESHEAADIVVKISDHPEILGFLLGDFAAKRLHKFLGSRERIVRRVG